MTSLTRPVKFACPVHKVVLDEELYCSSCAASYPIINGVPILLNERNSVFRYADYLAEETVYTGASSYGGHLDQSTGLRQWYRRTVSKLSESDPVPSDFGVADAIKEINEAKPDAEILVIGAGDTIYDGNVTYSDVALGKHVNCIADSHDLPFENKTFDACIACAVLEHVADPQRCVAEIERVLKENGYVFAETPFLQPVHMGAYDFTRFTYLGHRRLFRRFAEIKSGLAAGPGTSTAHVVRHLLISLTDRPLLGKIFKLVGLLITYPLRYADVLAKRHVRSYDSASAFYFFGTLQPEPIPDREILKLFRGGR